MGSNQQLQSQRRNPSGIVVLGMVADTCSFAQQAVRVDKMKPDGTRDGINVYACMCGS